MNKALISFIGLLLLLWGVCLPAGAEDLVWQPRTPAGGAATLDPDFYFQMAQAAKQGSGSARYQVYQTFGDYPMGLGYYEINEDGSLTYYDRAGKEMDLRNVGEIETDTSVGENAVRYYSTEKSVSHTGP
ncbi:MAG: hypothetical protein SWQ30_03740 [Thermodesulfobacteriota bacterium]|nr:hypothetical protein [Thermodesulfobacteriota bacterium]